MATAARLNRTKLLWVSLLVSSGYGQNRLSVQEAINKALGSNPLIEVAAGRSDQAKGQQTQAGLKPNPRLFLQTEDVRWWGAAPYSYWQSTEEYAYVGQLIETAGKRSKRVAVASSDLRGSELSEDVQKRELAARVSSVYWAAEGAAQIRELYQQTLVTYDEDVAYNRNRVQEGLMAEADLLRLRTERELVSAQATAASTEAERTIVELYRAMGQTEVPPTLLTDNLSLVPTVSFPSVQDVLSIRPEEQFAREQIKRAQQNVALQRANGKPDPEIYAGYKRNVGQDTLYAAVQIDVPIRNRNQGNVGTALAEVRVAEANLRATEANISADITSATRVYREQRRLVEGLSNTREQANESERLARGAYREGGIDLIRLLDAERSRISIEMQYLRALVGLRQSVVTLQFVTGQDIRP